MMRSILLFLVLLFTKPAFAAPTEIDVIEFRGVIQGSDAEKLILGIRASSPEFVLILDSPGGDMDSAQAVITEMRKVGRRSVCVAKNRIASAAFWIYQNCDIRIALKNSVLMAHHGSLSISGVFSVHDLKSVTSRLEIMNKLMLSEIASRLNLRLDTLIERTKSDWWMDAEEAVRVGAVDLIVGDVSEFEKLYANTK
jgi:ATP-dependent protease ClpP protease subunit